MFHPTRTFCLAMTVVAMTNAAARSQVIIAGPTTSPVNGHVYYLLSPAPWTSSESVAIGLGGHLATIRNAGEQAWVFGTFGTVGGINRSLWIGYNDAAVEGTFVWASGETPAYTNWLPMQPDNNMSFSPAGEDYVHMLKTGNGFGLPPGLWNDMDNFDSFTALGPTAGVVEVTAVPEPSALLMACSFAGAAVTRRKFKRICKAQTG